MQVVNITGARTKSGSYTGDGQASQTISGIGFKPVMLIVSSASNPYYFFVAHGADINGESQVIDVFNGNQDYISDMITNLGNNTFSVSTTANSLGAVYYFTAVG